MYSVIYCVIHDCNTSLCIARGTVYVLTIVLKIDFNRMTGYKTMQEYIAAVASHIPLSGTNIISSLA